MGLEYIGAPGRTRTLNLLIRSQTLYPIELRALIIRTYETPDPNTSYTKALGTFIIIAR